MIFVYPSIISENVREHMLPAVTKVMEQFYLLHILQSFTDGTLRVKTIYNPSKKVYGPLLLENKKILGENTMLLNEATLPPVPAHLSSSAGPAQTIANYDYNYKLPDIRLLSADGLIEEKKKLEGHIADLELAINNVEDLIDRASEYHSGVSSGKIDGDKNEAFTWHKYLNTLRKNIEVRKKRYQGSMRSFDIALQSRKKEGDDTFKDAKEEREKEKFDAEKQKDKEKQARIHGTYQIKDIQGLSLQPTMATVKVKIHYVGGPDGSSSGGGGEDDYHEVPIGVKVTPMQVENFMKIQDAILDDYFSSRAMSFWKTKYRNVARTLIRFVERVVKKISGKNIDMTDMIKDPVQRQIIMAPSGFVDASSFKKKPDNPSFYNYSSASVIFLKDDMTHEGGENFFQDKTEMKKMFKKGWNTFCVLDDISEIAHFISALDGGQLHTLPYSYIFNSLNMDKVYDSDEFKRRAKGFRMRSGNIHTLVNKLKRESLLIESMKVELRK